VGGGGGGGPGVGCKSRAAVPFPSPLTVLVWPMALHGLLVFQVNERDTSISEHRQHILTALTCQTGRPGDPEPYYYIAMELVCALHAAPPCTRSAPVLGLGVIPAAVAHGAVGCWLYPTLDREVGVPCPLLLSCCDGNAVRVQPGGVCADGLHRQWPCLGSVQVGRLAVAPHAFGAPLALRPCLWRHCSRWHPSPPPPPRNCAHPVSPFGPPRTSPSPSAHSHSR
jgi:hypothetical protein